MAADDVARLPLARIAANSPPVNGIVENRGGRHSFGLDELARTGTWLRAGIRREVISDPAGAVLVGDRGERGGALLPDKKTAQLGRGALRRLAQSVYKQAPKSASAVGVSTSDFNCAMVLGICSKNACLLEPMLGVCRLHAFAAKLCFGDCSQSEGLGAPFPVRPPT